MRRQFYLLIQVTAIVLAVGAFPGDVALAEDAHSLTEQLRTQYKLTKTGFDSSGFVVLEPAVVLVIKKAGIISVPPADGTLVYQVYKDGQFRGVNGAALGLLGVTTRYLQVGENVYVGRLDINLKSDKVTLFVFECDSCNGATQQSSYKGGVCFQFPKGYLGRAEPAQVTEVINQVFSVDTGVSGDAQQPPSPQGQQQTPVEQPATNAPPPPQPESNEPILRNQDVIKMTKAGLDDAVIVAKIKGSRCQFDTAPDTLIELKKTGVSSAVLKAMTESSNPPRAADRSQTDHILGLA
jgi:hypothetical protein